MQAAHDSSGLVRAFERHLARALKDAALGSRWHARALFLYAEQEGWFAQAAAWPGADGSVGFEFRMKPMALDPVWWELQGQALDPDPLAARLLGGACPAPLLASARHDWTEASPLDMADRFLDFAEQSCGTEVARLSGVSFADSLAHSETGALAATRLIALLAEERYDEARAVIAASGARDETVRNAAAWLESRAGSRQGRHP